MKSLVLLTILLFFQTAYAADDSKNLYQKIIEIISRINTGKVVSTPENKCTEENAPTLKIVSPLFNKCAVDICGPAKKNKSVWVTDTNFSSSIPKDVLKKVTELDPLFERIFKIAQEQRQLEQKEIQQLFLKMTNNPDSATFDLREQMASDLFSKYINVQINADADLENRISVNVSLPPNASSDLTKAVNTYAKNTASRISTDSRLLDFQNAYGSDEYQKLAQLHFAKVKKSFDTHKGSITENLDYSFKVLDELLNKDMDKLHFDQAMMQIKHIDDTISYNTKSPALLRATCETPECKRVFDNFLNSSQLNLGLKKYNSILASPQARENAINKCKALIITKGLKESEEKKRQAVFASAKKAIVQNFLPRFSTHSKEVMNEYLNQTLVVSGIDIRKKMFPSPDPIEYFEQAARYFMETASPKKTFFNIKSSSAYDPTDNSRWAKLTNIYMKNGDVNPYDDVLPCIGNAFTSWDMFLPVKEIDFTNPQYAPLKDLKPESHIFISDHSCENHPQGTHNTSHEIGHALNYLFRTAELSKESAALYKNLRACGNGHYPKAPVSIHGLPHEGDMLYTEEDVADLIAFAANPGDKTIYSCQLLRPNLQLDGYESLTLIDPEATHSTGLTRSILEMVNKGIPLPTSCQQLIELEKPDINLKKCI